MQWGFCYAKRANVTAKIAEEHPGAGDVWIWAAICADTKLVPSWCIGNRDMEAGLAFLRDLSKRMSGRIQLSSDGHPIYPAAVEEVFGTEIDFGQIIKIYKAERQTEARYSPAACTGCKKKAVQGAPDEEHISTSYAERMNLNVRMQVRRMTRLTNSFSRKIENHAAAMALYYFTYNFIRIHRTLKVTPAMAAGVTTRLFEVADLVVLLEEAETSKAA